MRKLLKIMLLIITTWVFISIFITEINSKNSIPLVNKPMQLLSNGIAHVAANTTNNVYEKMTANQALRIQENNDLIQRKKRLASLSGCSTNAKRTNCKCFDKFGSIESILNKEQCLAVVDRGLAALNDF
ncbi:MAG: hypothetical protein HOP20_07065 [Sulfuriferula sp.]|nr:hypothetical protein [Sulfuriferula sp.]